MQSSSSHEAARSLLASASNVLRRSGLSIPDIRSFFGNVFNNIQNYTTSAIRSKLGKTVLSFIATTGSIWAGQRIMDYVYGHRTFEQAFLTLPHANTVGAAALQALPQAFAKSTRYYIHPFKRFYKLRKSQPYVYPGLKPSGLSTVVKYGTGATAATTLGAIALKKTAQLFRKLYHRN